VSTLFGWVSSASEDVSLLTRAYLPELLVVTLFVLLSFGIRRVFTSERRSSR
jgi:hypothetical protein